MGTDLEIRAQQGTETANTFTLTAGFQGTETLSLAVHVGDNQAAISTLTPTWTAGQTTGSYTQVDLTITAAQASALPWGVYAITLTIDTSSVWSLDGILTVYPGPGGTGRPFQRLLASPAMATSYLPSLSRDNYDTMAAALAAATEAVEGYCQQPLVLDSYDHFGRPINSNRLWLKSRPVVELTRCAAGETAALWVSNTTATLATVNQVLTTPGQPPIASLTFIATTAGVATTQTITLSSYATIDALATAINALGNGWAATANSTTSDYPASDLYGTVGARDARYGRPEFYVSTQPLSEYVLYGDEGYIEINQGFPGNGMVPNYRLERLDSRNRGLRVAYRAGYAYLKVDSDLGYRTVPEDLAAAVILTAQSILESAPAAGPVKSQSVKDRSYEFRDATTVIPGAAKELLARGKYVRFVV